MKVALALGGEVDVATGDELHHMGESILGRLDGLERAGRDARPLRRTLVAAARAPASGSTTTVLTLGGPAVGRIWNVTYVTVAGSDDSTVVPNATLALYTGDPAAPSLAGLVIPANGSAVPNSASFSQDQLWVHDDEQMFVVVYGAPVSQALSAVARVLDYPAVAREPRGV